MRTLQVADVRDRVQRLEGTQISVASLDGQHSQHADNLLPTRTDTITTTSRMLARPLKLPGTRLGSDQSCRPCTGREETRVGHRLDRP